MGIINTFRKNFRNIPGWRTGRKILVLESDDWGSERARGPETIKNLVEAGYKVKKCTMSISDSLESNTDLELLFEVLKKFKDRQGNHPVITAFFNMANPDYSQIKATDFQEYHYLTIPETALQYSDHNRIVDLYQEGSRADIFHAEYHGREHLHVQRWLRDLRSGHTDTTLGFNLGFNGFSKSYAPKIKKTYRASYEPDVPADINFMKSSVIDGLKLFEDLFSYRANYFVPPNGPYPRTDNFEEELKKHGIQYLGGPSMQKITDEKGREVRKHFSLGSKNEYGQTFITRNGIFEPHSPNRNWVSYCLQDIQLAFRWSKPAIISTHRANFVGTVDPKNREKGLTALRELLGTVLKKWPDTEFMSSRTFNALVK